MVLKTEEVSYTQSREDQKSYLKICTDAWEVDQRLDTQQSEDLLITDTFDISAPSQWQYMESLTR